MKIENLKFGSDTITSLTFSGQEVNKLVMPDGNYWEKETSFQDASFKPLLFGVDTDNIAYYDVEIKKGNNSLSNYDMEIRVSAADFFIIHLNECKNCGSITKSGTMNCSYVDNHAFIVYRDDGYGSWPGGLGLNMWSNPLSIRTENGETRTLSFYSKLDEDNTRLLRGDCVGKVFRIPANGIEEYIELYKYPYTFAPYYYTDSLPELSLLTIGYKSVLTTNIGEGYSNDKISITPEFGASILECKIKYKIEPNSFGTYREFAIIGKSSYSNLYNKQGSTWGMVYFIQEPKNKNRIYYGPYFNKDRSFNDSYCHALEGNKEQYNYYAFFETCSSKVIKDGDYLNVKSSTEIIAYNNDSDYKAIIESGLFSILSEDYVWGDMHYTLLQINTDGKIRFVYKDSGPISDVELQLGFMAKGTGQDDFVVTSDLTNLDLENSTSFTIGVPIIKSINTNGIVTSPSFISTNGRWISLIEDYALLLADTGNFGDWGGTQCVGTIDNCAKYSWLLAAASDSTTTKRIDVYKPYNDNPVLLIEGTTKTKAIRVPSSVREGSISIQKYEEDTSSEFYSSNLRILPIEKNSSNEWKAKSKYTGYTSSYVINQTFRATVQKISDTSYTIDYRIENNNTSEYREFAFSVGPILTEEGTGQSYIKSECVIHFIQEPYAKNRIYYGQGFPNNFSDQYSNNTAEYHSIFETCSSRVLTAGETITCSENTYIAFPTSDDFDYNITWTSGNYSPLHQMYYWGNKSYRLYKITKTSNLRFRKKV